MKPKRFKFKDIFVQSDGELRYWVTLAIYGWFVFLAFIILLEFI